MIRRGGLRAGPGRGGSMGFSMNKILHVLAQISEIVRMSIVRRLRVGGIA